MKLQDSVSVISGSVKLPASVTAYLQHNKDEFEDDDIVKGGVLQDFKFAWLANGSKFVVINIKTGHKIAAWTFGAVLRDFKTTVMCVCEIPPLIENTKQLLIGLECDMVGGLVCLFHCQGSRVLRAIRLDCRVSCLQYVDSFPSGPLQCFDGTVVIGTHGGSVLAFDLNRQSCIEAIMFGKSGKEVLIRDELNIGNLFTLSIEDIALIEEQRAIACEKDDHIAIQVNEGCFHNLQFILHGPDNAVRLRATRERVFVTNLLYIPQLGSIVIGFNFGAFQLWNVMTLELEYTSPVSSDQLPISHFGFLEPCDDPRAFSYLWVIYSSLDRHEEGFPLAAMYAFSYHGKTSLGDGVYLYQNFISCNLRFNVELNSVDATNVNLKQMVGGRSLACHTLTKAVGRSSDTDESVLNLCQIVWECWTVSAITPVQSIMIIFDIDQWYKEQMPELTTLESNSFLSVVNLGDTLSHTASCYLCDVRINKESLAPYYSVPRLEEHYYPNSLGYECVCLTNTDVTRLSTVGVQRQLLSSLSEIGPSVLLHPTKVFMQCVACGLIPLYMEPSPNPTTPLPKQRQTLLSIALEARLICFLSDCARDWATGSHSSIGCSLPSFTQWAWLRAMTLKSNADQLTIPLFDHSGDGPDANSVSCLESCTRQLGHLAKLFNIMLDKCANLMLPEAIKELKQKQKAVQVVSLYFQVVQWFLNVGLLPEFSMNSQHSILERNADRLPYPVDSLVRYYQHRRQKLHCLNGDNPAVENLQNKSCPLLFIDQFIKMECAEEKLKKFWLEDGSNTKGLYPPPSLLSLLRTYLIPGILDENKHSLVLYVLVDYAMTFDEAQYESVIRRLMQFPTMFGLSSNAIKLTQAFWHLDHRDFELALDQLESVVAGGWLKQWQHSVALSSLLVQNKTQAALQYLYIRKPLLPLSSREDIVHSRNNILYDDDDWETCCNLYLSRGLLLEAFNLTKDSFRTLSSPDSREQRMILFLEGCKKMNLLSKALILPLSQEEEGILTNFLKALGDSDAHDLLIMYYLQRSRFIEAQHVNDNLKRLSTKGQLPYDVSSDFSMKKDHIPKTKTRDELVDMYCKTLPKVTRNLAHLASQHVLPSRMSMPTPMTVSLQASVPKPATYRSSIIQATINKANETWLERPGVVRSLKRALQVEDTPFICTPKMERHTSRLNDFEKMITTPEDMIISPAKRPRLEDGLDKDAESCITTPEDPKVRREVETLLHTPIVERRGRWRSDSRADSTREATPQSILKVRTKLLDEGSIDERHYAETDEEFDTASVNTQSDNLSRSIRFNIPSPGNSPSRSITPTDLNESYEELSGIRPFGHSSFRNQSSYMKISPRKSIHQTEIDDEEEVEEDMISPVVNISTPIKRTPLRGRKLISPPNDVDNSFTNENQNNELLFEEDNQQNITVMPSQDEVIINKQTSESRIHEIQVTYSDVESNHSESTSEIDRHSEGEEVGGKPLTPSCAIRERLKRGPQPRRSLRNTPEREKTLELENSRVLRSRSRTPEREVISPVVKLSPSKSTPGKTRKSLARLVLEQNALSVSKVITKTETFTETHSETFKESKIEQDTSFKSHVSNVSKYESLMNSKLFESYCPPNESLLSSDISEVETDISLETVEPREDATAPKVNVCTEIPITKEDEEPTVNMEVDTSIVVEPPEEGEPESEPDKIVVIEPPEETKVEKEQSIDKEADEIIEIEPIEEEAKDISETIPECVADKVIVIEPPEEVENEEKLPSDIEVEPDIVIEPLEEAIEYPSSLKHMPVIEEMDELTNSEFKKSSIKNVETADNEPDEIGMVVTPEKQETLNAIFSRSSRVSYDNLNVFGVMEPKTTETVIIENITEDVDMDDNIDIVTYCEDPVETHKVIVEPDNDYKNIIADEESNSDNLVIDTDVYESNAYEEQKSFKVPQECDESLLHSESEFDCSSDDKIVDDDDEESSVDIQDEVVRLRNEQKEESEEESPETVADEGSSHSSNAESRKSDNAESHDSEYSSKSSDDNVYSYSSSQSQSDDGSQDTNGKSKQVEADDVIHIISSDDDENSSDHTPKSSKEESSSSGKQQETPQTFISPTVSKNIISDSKYSMEVVDIPVTNLEDVPSNAQEDLKNMSLMTEEGSMAEDPISLKLSDDEAENMEVGVEQNAPVDNVIETPAPVIEKSTKSYDPASLDAELNKTNEFLSKSLAKVEENVIENKLVPEIVVDDKSDVISETKTSTCETISESVSSNINVQVAESTRFNVRMEEDEQSKAIVEEPLPKDIPVVESEKRVESQDLQRTPGPKSRSTLDNTVKEDIVEKVVPEKLVKKIVPKVITDAESEKTVESMDAEVSENNVQKTLTKVENTVSSIIKDDKESTGKAVDNSKIVREETVSIPVINISHVEAKESATPKRVTRRRTSAQSDASTPIQKTPENKVNLDSSIARSTRSASKKRQQSVDSHSPGSVKSIPDVEDDRRSTVSNASSIRSSIVTDTSSPNKEEEKGSVSRKSRKSAFSLAKPNLSVIPEVSQGELNKTDLSRHSRDVTENDSSAMEQYISSRRVTRHQKSLLEKSFANSSIDASTRSRKTKRSSAGPSNVTEETIYEDEESEVSGRDPQDVTSPRKNLTDKTMDPLELMNKQDFKGRPDPDELSRLETASMSSISSSVFSEYTDIPNTTITARSKRAMSETVGSIAEIKKSRRLSVDAAPSPGPSGVLDDSVTESPGRPRRRSFNKAVEALHTPKRRRRGSTDSRNDTDGGSDTSISDRMTPNIFKDKPSEMNQSKLLVIEEDDVGEGTVDNKEEHVATPKPVKRVKKAASVHDYRTPDNKDVKKSRARMSQLLTPLSKEEQQDMEYIEKPRFRRRTTMHKVIQPIEFVPKKK